MININMPSVEGAGTQLMRPGPSCVLAGFALGRGLLRRRTGALA